MTANQRDLEQGIALNLEDDLTYGGYLHLDKLLHAQEPLSEPAHHDEMLFIIQHQVAELWLKLVTHELQSAIEHLRSDRLDPCLKILSRVKQIQRQMFEQWAVLETLTPTEYAQFRNVLKHASGFQSLQYRKVEFLLGNKHAGMLDVFSYDPEGQAALREVLNAPSLYDEFIQYLSRSGHDVASDLLDRDFSTPHEQRDDLTAMFKNIYDHPQKYWGEYHMCEQLIDVEESFQLWRFRHMKTVERIIGHKVGTGGSSGVDFLKRALDLKFFPELLAVRTHFE